MSIIDKVVGTRIDCRKVILAINPHAIVPLYAQPNPSEYKDTLILHQTYTRVMRNKKLLVLRKLADDTIREWDDTSDSYSVYRCRLANAGLEYVLLARSYAKIFIYQNDDPLLETILIHSASCLYTDYCRK